jgi:uncharacterized protein (DUF1810 family)
MQPTEPPSEYDLQRFVEAQGPVLDKVRAELLDGEKQTHWMWFIFPQLAGLGHSPTARYYAIASRGHAEAYLAHSILGPRLRDCTQLVTRLKGRSVEQIFGYPDNLKFHSCMTLFAQVAPAETVFVQALERYFGGELDPLTCKWLRSVAASEPPHKL